MSRDRKSNIPLGLSWKPGIACCSLLGLLAAQGLFSLGNFFSEFFALKHFVYFSAFTNLRHYFSEVNQLESSFLMTQKNACECEENEQSLEKCFGL